MKDFNELVQEHFGVISSDELAHIRSFFKEEKLSATAYFTKTNQYCSRLSFVKSGILRIYGYFDGKEVTQWIAAENSLITEVTGFFFEQPNRWNIQAFTAVELLTISRDDYRCLCQEIPSWSELEKKLMLKCFAQIEERVFSHLSMSAEERYDRYFAYNKELFNQIPLHYIASVLGMTPETFSRIRKRKAENS